MMMPLSKLVGDFMVRDKKRGVPRSVLIMITSEGLMTKSDTSDDAYFRTED